MTGYQEILTDPSYAGQIVTLTYPHIGNVGVNPEDVESRRPFAAGLVIRDLPRLASNFRATGDLGAYLVANNIVGIADLDTRRLTRLLRERGAQNGCLVARAVDRRRRRRAGRRAREGRAVDGRARSREGRQLHGALRVDGGHLGAGRRLPAARRRRASTSSPTTTASSTTSCALLAERRLPADRGARADAGGGGPRARAGRRLPFERPRRSRALRVRDPRDRHDRRRAACRRSASASAISCWRSRRERGR